MKPYIGVTGFTEARQILEVLERSGLNTNCKYQLMVGVLVSEKSLAGIRSNKYQNRYPAKDSLNKIFIDDPRCLNLIHYYQGRNLHQHDGSLSKRLTQIRSLCRKNLHGFQLNIAWPHPDELKQFRKRNPGQVIVLQVGTGAMRMLQNDPASIRSRIRTYENIVDYVLLDASGGDGIPVDYTEAYKPILAEIWLDQINDHCRIGIAGGLCKDRLQYAQPLLKRYPGLSIDAEGQLRDKQTDLFIMDKVCDYVRGARNLLC